MGYFKDIDYRDKSAPPEDRVPDALDYELHGDDSIRSAPDATDTLAGVVSSDGSVNEPSEPMFTVYEITPPLHWPELRFGDDDPNKVAAWLKAANRDAAYAVDSPPMTQMLPADQWLNAYRSLKPWLVGGAS